MGVLLGLVLGSQPAAASPTTISVEAGTLGVTSPATNALAAVVLNGTAQVAEVSIEPFSVTDARGSGAGWSLTAQATPFREWHSTAYVPDGKTLPVGSLTLAGLSVKANGTESVTPGLVAGPHVVDGPAITIATAEAGTGMGTFVFTPGVLRVTVPARTYARAYRSELSISITSGP